MKGDVVAAAKWLGSSLIVASLILAGGVHWAFKTRERPGLVAQPPDLPSEVAFRPVRVQELLTESEKLREAGDDWDRTWFLDQPSQMTPFRTHGGLGP